MPLLFEFQRRRRGIFTLSMGMYFFVKIKKRILKEKMLRAKSDKKNSSAGEEIECGGKIFFSLWKQFPAYEKPVLGRNKERKIPSIFFFFAGRRGGLWASVSSGRRGEGYS